MPYIIKSYRGVNSNITINDKQKDTGSTSLTLIGKDYEPYGEIILTNLYNMLENFAGPIPPSNPVVGQIWYDTSTQQVKVYSSLGTWEIFGGLTTGTTFPSSPNAGDMFFYNDGGFNKILYVYDGTSWFPANGLVISNTPPTTGLTNGLLWFNTIDYNYYIFRNGYFVKILTGGSYGLNPSGGKSTFDFVSISASSTKPKVNIGIVEISGDIVSIISENNITAAELAGNTYTTKDNSLTFGYNSKFPQGINAGLNLRGFYSNITFSDTLESHIINNSTNTNAVLRFRIGNDNILNVKSSRIEMTKPLEFTNQDYMKLPIGTSANRPPAPQPGQIRYNQATNMVEYYNGSSWIPLSNIVFIQEAPMLNIGLGQWRAVHNLGTTPRLFYVVVRFIAPQGTYQPGHEILMATSIDYDEGAGPSRNMVETVATNDSIYFLWRYDGTPDFRLGDLNTNTLFSLDVSNVIFIARWIP